MTTFKALSFERIEQNDQKERRWNLITNIIETYYSNKSNYIPVLYIFQNSLEK